MSAARFSFLRVGLQASVLLLLPLVSTQTLAAELWATPDESSTEKVGNWAVTHGPSVGFSFHVPDNMTAFRGAKIVVIPVEDGEMLYRVTLSLAQNGDRYDTYTDEITGVTPSLTADAIAEIDVSDVFPPSMFPGQDFVSLQVRSPSRTWIRVLGMRFIYEGEAGPEGPTGAAGPDGPTGPTGEPGAEGPAGSTGAQGAAGAPGVQGPMGPIGPTGQAGPQGDPGLQGATGAQGPIGQTGPQGDPGLQGATGAQGPIGQTGPQGDPGLQGATGAQGPTGVTGLQGDPGTAGATGAQGPIGQTGPQGDPGLQGATGAQGPTGDPGTPGATGAQGPIGQTGPQGDPGLQGATGAQGPTGDPGTPGATGAQGPIGQTGPQGDPGLQGMQGIQGPTGPPGTQGPTGAQGEGLSTSCAEGEIARWTGGTWACAQDPITAEVKSALCELYRETPLSPPDYCTLKVFVTSSTYSGDLLGEAASRGYSGSDALEGGDYLCNQVAAAASLPGTYRAWLSTATVDAKDRLTSTNSPWDRVDGARVADNLADLLDCTEGVGFECLENPINIDETGTSRLGTAYTGTNSVGTREDSRDCQGWISTPADGGWYGETTSVTNRWTLANRQTCVTARHLYCFEQ